jgi:endonuclease YncB( thermonuclease family)
VQRTRRITLGLAGLLALAACEGRMSVTPRTPRFRVDSGTDQNPRPDSGSTQNNAIVNVRAVFDGDTIELGASAGQMTPDGMPLNREHVRLLGIDAPEIEHPPMPADCWGDDAHSALRNQVQGLDVELEYAGSTLRDDFGRLLAYVTLTSNGELVNRWLVRQGHARALDRFSHPRRQEFDRAESDARNDNLGLWTCP